MRAPHLLGDRRDGVPGDRKRPARARRMTPRLKVAEAAIHARGAVRTGHAVGLTVEPRRESTLEAGQRVVPELRASAGLCPELDEKRPCRGDHGRDEDRRRQRQTPAPVDGHHAAQRVPAARARLGFI